MVEAAVIPPTQRGSRVARVVGVLAIGLLLAWVVFRCPLPFVPSWWNVDAERGTMLRTRYRIADHLVGSGRLIGMSKSDVVGLLGPPADADKFTDHGLVYVLGPERGWISIDYEWLLVDFDSAGRVNSAVVVSD